MLPNVKTKYQKEIKVVIFLLVLYSLAKCFYSVFRLWLSHFAWKNNNLGVHFQHWQLQVMQIYMPNGFFLCPDITHSALETPAVRPTKNSWLVHKMWMAAHCLSHSSSSLLWAMLGRTRPWELVVLKRLHMSPKRTQDLNSLQQSHSSSPAVHMYLGQCLLPTWMLSTMCPELTQVAPSTGSETLLGKHFKN